MPLIHDTVRPDINDGEEEDENEMRARQERRERERHRLGRELKLEREREEIRLATMKKMDLKESKGHEFAIPYEHRCTYVDLPKRRQCHKAAVVDRLCPQHAQERETEVRCNVARF